MLRLLAVVLLIMAGASGALAAEPVFPLTLQGWVAEGQDAFLTYAKLDDRRVPSPGTEAKWAVPTGLLTVRDVGPTDPTACPLAECSLGRLLTGKTGVLTFSAQVTPLAVAPGVDYVVVLRAHDGHVYDIAGVKWSRSDLVGNDPAERSVVKRKKVALRHNRRVEVKAPYDDVSVPPFIEEYNQAFDSFLKDYQAAKSREQAIDPLAVPLLAAIMPGSVEAPDQEAAESGESEIERIFNQHFILELVDARIFAQRMRDRGES